MEFVHIGRSRRIRPDRLRPADPPLCTAHLPGYNSRPVPASPSDDLARWMPRLLAAWRAVRRGGRGSGPRPPADALLPDELREIGAAVGRLSRGLTRERELAGARYMDEPRLLGAYLLFYWPTSYLQARGTISELRRRPRTVLDLGSGPAPVAFAALDAGAAEVVAADRSARALATARDLARAAGEPLGTREWNPHRTPLAALAEGRRFDLVTMGHLVNELFGGEGADAAVPTSSSRRSRSSPPAAPSSSSSRRSATPRGRCSGCATSSWRAGTPSGRRASSAARAPRSSARPTGATRSAPWSRRRSSPGSRRRRGSAARR